MAEGAKATDTSFSGEAYRNALPAANALRADELVVINIDVPKAVVTAIGALPGTPPWSEPWLKLSSETCSAASICRLSVRRGSRDLLGARDIELSIRSVHR